MALTTDNVLITLHKNFIESGGKVNTNWQAAYRIHTDAATLLRVNAMIDPGAVAAWDGIAAATEVAPDAFTPMELAYAQKALGVPFSKLQAQESGSMVSDSGIILGANAWKAVGAIAAAPLNDGFTTYLTASDGIAFFNALHPTAAGTRSNYLSSALDAAAVKTLRAMLRKWVTSKDLTVDLDDEGIYLMVASDLVDTAREVVNSLYGFTSIEDNAAGKSAVTVVHNPYLTNQTSWFGISKSASPLHCWLREMPNLSIVNGDLGQVTPTVTLAVAAGAHIPDGIIGCKA